MRRKARAFLFDMDGVIVDSNPVHRVAWVEYNRRHGVETTPEMHERMYGKRNHVLIRDFLGDHLTDEEIDRHSELKEELFRRMMLPRIREALVPGLRSFLERYRGVPMAVASNASPENVEFVLREAGLGEFFPVALHGGEVARAKPYPDIYLRAAELLGVAAAECVVFEDSATGVEAGVAAGMPVVGLSTTHETLEGVEVLVRDFNDPALEAWLSGALATVS